MNPLDELILEGLQTGWMRVIIEPHKCHHEEESFDDSYIFRCPACGDVKPYHPSGEND